MAGVRPALHRIRRSSVMFIVIMIVILLLGASAAAQDERTAPVLHVNGAIGPATSDYIGRALDQAREKGAPFVVIQMDTPGGLDSSMRDIIRNILHARVPVITYVSPSGGRAASAGTYILYASHVAAMAPGTNVGAATPVQLGGGGGSPFAAPPDKEDTKAKKPAKTGSASEAKALNDAIAYIRSLAEMRGRNVVWAEAAVRDAASLSAQAALEQKVIDVVARDRADLLKQIHGRTVTASGAKITIDTRNIQLADAHPNWRTRLLAAITDPNIALILMMIGIYGLMFEFMNPGAIYPGTIGAICLLTGLYALTALPVNYAGIALILLGIGLMTAEAFAPSFGISGIGGVLAFILGATIMIDSDIPQFQIDWPVLAALALISLAFFLIVARMAVTAHRRRVVTGREDMIGAAGILLDWRDGKGHVFVHSERWRAIGATELHAEMPVRITAIDGLVLGVEARDRENSVDRAVTHNEEN